MTRLEADICMKKSFPVHIKGEDFSAPFYKIVSAHKYKHKLARKWSYSFGVAPENTWRSSVTVSLDKLIIDDKYKDRLQSEVECNLFENVELYIKELLAAGVIKTAIREKINKMLREAKKNE